MRNYFTFDGVDSRSFGVYISGQGTFKAPARSYDAIEIPGRNGALLGIDSRLGNVELTYPAFIYSNFAENIAAFRAFLLSHKGYFKLKDSYHPNEFRLAYYPGPFEPDVTSANNAGSFDITFICKPQRYLESGQEVVELSPSTAQVETYTGIIAEIEPGIGDRVTGLTVPFIPIQDLHGYSHPWPGGGGKNLIDFDQIVTQSVYTPVVYLTEGTYYFYVANDTSLAFNSFVQISTDGNTFANITTDTESPNAYADQRMQHNVKKCIVTVVAPTYCRVYIQNNAALSGATVKVLLTKDATNYSDIPNGVYSNDPYFEQIWTPYSNICPISGRTGVVVTRTGKNLFPTASVNLGKPNSRTQNIILSEPIPAGSYVFSYVRGGTYTGTAFGIEAFNGNTAIGYVNANNGKITLSDMATRFYIYLGTAPYNNDETITFSNCQLELGSTATDYEVYQGTTYAVDWTTEAGTVYGGTLDVVTGVLTVDKGYVDMGSLSWSRNATYNVMYAYVTGKANGRGNLICSNYKTVELYYEYLSSGEISGALNNNAINVKDDAYTSAADFKTAMNGVQLVYTLATPIAYQLTPQDITLIQNALNYIWSNAGPVTVEVTEGLRVTNPTLFVALPFLRVYGTGILGIGSHTITITAADVYTDIDCEMMDCFKGSANKNQYVQFSGNDFPTLEPGVNGFTFSGITKVEVKPRWWSV